MLDQTSWFVAYTYPKSEKKVHDRIQRSGIESYLPLHKVRRVWSDRVKFVEVPLFSSYVFVRTKKEHIPQLKDIQGIARFVSFQNRYAEVKDEEIDLIQKLLEKGHDLQLQPNRFQKGSKVRVKTGPFVGLKGMLVRKEGKNRFLVELENLDQLISINIPINYLEALIE